MVMHMRTSKRFPLDSETGPSRAAACLVAPLRPQAGRMCISQHLFRVFCRSPTSGACKTHVCDGTLGGGRHFYISLKRCTPCLDDTDFLAVFVQPGESISCCSGVRGQLTDVIGITSVMLSSAD